MKAAVGIPKVRRLGEARVGIASLGSELEQLQYCVRQLEKELYGLSSERQVSERFSKEPTLLSLFPKPAMAEAAVTQPVRVELHGNSGKTRMCRQLAPGCWRWLGERIEPEERVCPRCGQVTCERGCERSERFEYVPARIIRHETIHPKRACRWSQSGVSIAPLPPQVMEQGQAGAGLVAQVLLSKYDDHQPLYRQQQQSARLGVEFWVADVVRPDGNASGVAAADRPRHET